MDWSLDISGPEPTVTSLIERVRSYNPAADFNLIRRAFVFAEQHHRPQRRKSGDPYIGHPVAVANLLSLMKLDDASICAALLHDTVEDTDATLEDLTTVFSAEIADLVDGVTKLNKIRFRTKEERQAENFRKMVIAMSRDIRVILVKLADRTHNMRTLGSLPPHKRLGIARETMDIFAPIAHRLGLGTVKNELEDLCFRHLHEDAYKELSGSVNTRRAERKEYVGRVVAELNTMLEANAVEATVNGRPKHFWSIWKKMEKSGVSFREVYDATAFRVIVKSQSECYHALGLIHERWPPIPGRFKDYVAAPKENGYKSLHTSIIGPEGTPIEVQIRTDAMHRIAEGGIAAHWLYKSGGGDESARNHRNFDWLKRIMDFQTEHDDPTEFLEQVRYELFADEVHIYTPKGELKVMPRGSTPVDFAYAIHSEVGDTCSGATVNGARVPLSAELHNGDFVSIDTRTSQRPNKDWLLFVKSGRAKSCIKAYVRREQQARMMELGEQLLDKEFRRYSKSFARIRKTKEFAEAGEKFHLEDVDLMIRQVGVGILNAEAVVAHVLPEARSKTPKDAEGPAQNPISRLFRRVTDGGAPSSIVVDGMDGIRHSIAKCCAPVPGEAIVGYVTPAHIISVHGRSCSNTVGLPRERLVDVRWGQEEVGYAVHIEAITGSGRSGMLTRMTKVFGDLKLNISMANCAELDDGSARNHFRFKAKNIGEVNKVLRKLKGLRGVDSVKRLRDQ